MSPQSFETLLVALGKEFRRRRMNGHVAALRRFYRARKQRALLSSLADHKPWDEDVVLEWLSIFQIPPFDRVYVQQPKDAPCPACGTGRALGADVTYCAVFPGGSQQQCKKCKTTWLVSDGTRSGTQVRGPGEIEEPDGGRAPRRR